MKTVLVTSLFLVFNMSKLDVVAQTVKYSYDANGNRIKRELVVTPPCSNCPNNPGGRSAHVDTTKAPIPYKVGVFPNPTQDKLNVNISNINSTETIDLMLSDENGRQILTLKNQPVQNLIDMEIYRPGIYYLQVTVGKDTPLVYKVMKVQ